MDFRLNDEQQQLAESIKKFLAKDYAFEQRKAILASPTGVSDKVWDTLAEMGVLAISLPESAGGFGGGAVDLMSTMEAVGDVALVEPLLSTLVAAHIVASDPAHKATLEAVAGGQCKLAWAHGEVASRYSLTQVTCSAKATANGYELTGAKSVVLHAPLASKIVVTARSSGQGSQGLSLFLVDANAPGLTMKTYRTVDNLRAADIEFSGLQLPKSALIGKEGQAFATIEEAMDFANALICAEAVGAMRSANNSTLEYLKTRKQFGVPIGAFQALQHRMVEMTIHAEQASSMALLACTKFDACAAGQITAAERSTLISAAKVKVADAARIVGQEAIQLHGGMGLTQEMKIAHTFKRLTMICQQYGDIDFHLQRFGKTA
jgi:alkylation response protein AidB-like acyl-CoA dehydrogenase